MVPEFAILGHPNEGKSSVLSTLAEDDSVRISPTPGETTACRSFPVIIDGQEIIRFTDTPGFQNPARVLVELKKRVKHCPDPLADFRQFASGITDLHDDCELLAPVARGAGIIYVVDGSRPVRNVDKAEMEILRLTGKPRMAVINSKEESEEHLEAWKTEFRKNFNSMRVFNAHRATYAERILLLEALQSIDQDWHLPLSKVVTAFRQDWAARNEKTAEIILTLLSESLSLTLQEKIESESDLEINRKKLFHSYSKILIKKERQAHERVRSLFKHNIFDYQLPAHSILHADLFDEKTWELLGLTKKQVVIAGGLGGAAIGAGLEMATLGHSLGIFTIAGTVVGTLGALFGGETFSGKARLLGMPLGGETLQIGPAKSINLLFVLLNRSLLFYQHTINWAHGRRDYDNSATKGYPVEIRQVFTERWPASAIKICHDFFKEATKQENDNRIRPRFHTLLLQTLQQISESDV